MANSNDPFERVAAAASMTPAAGAEPKGKGDNADLVAPAPADAPPPLTRHFSHGPASTVWTYRDAAGAVLRYVARFDLASGAKDVIPQTLWRKGRALVWRWKAEPGLRPLYGLQLLAQQPASPVLVVEGEKTADAAGALFPGYVVITWPGGSKATGKADWSPLAGRDVVVFPDADDPGRKAAKDVARQATAAGAATIAIVDVPTWLPDKWDLADAWPDGFAQSDALDAIETARAKANPAAIDWPWGFRMDALGLWYDQPGKDDTVIKQHLSAPFEVLAEARGADGGGWAVVVRFKDRDGREKTISILRSRLVGGGAEVRAELADAGLIVSPARGKADKFTIALAEVRCARRITLVSATGWCGERFVIPERPIGPVGGEAILFTGEAQALHYRRSGSLEGWRSNVAAKAPGNALLTFALSLAFCGPLLRLLDLEGGGVHFRGSSSCGKTTLALAAGSVWGGGGPLGFGHSWRSTANALEMLAAGHNDGLVVLDEIGLISTDEAGTAAYSLAAGQSKGRSQATGALRRRSEWRVCIISTGEISLADHIRAGKRGERPMAGQELRLLDVAADAGRHMGIWENLHGAEGPAALSDFLRSACARDFGHAGPSFVERLVVDRAAAVATAKDLLAGFLKKAAEAGDSGQAQRAAVRFGAIAAAGELATVFGVVPWPPGTASDAALEIYRRWATAFGRGAPREEREILRLIKASMEMLRPRFIPTGDGDEEKLASEGGRDAEARSTAATLGFRHVRGPDIEYRYFPAGWAEVLRGFNPADAARVVKEAGYLETDREGGRLTKRITAKGESHRCYCVKASLQEADHGD